MYKKNKKKTQHIVRPEAFVEYIHSLRHSGVMYLYIQFA